MTCAEFSAGSKTPWLFSIAACISNDLVHSGLWVSCMGSPSIAKNPQEQSVMQGHTMTQRPRLARDTAVTTQASWHLLISSQGTHFVRATQF